PGAIADELVDLADAAGGEDNATVVVIDADRVAPAAAAAVVGSSAPIRDVPRRSRRGLAVRLVTALVVLGLLGAAAIWLAGGGPGPGVPIPSVAAPSVGAPSVSAPAP